MPAREKIDIILNNSSEIYLKDIWKELVKKSCLTIAPRFDINVGEFHRFGVIDNRVTTFRELLTLTGRLMLYNRTMNEYDVDTK